MPVGRFLLCLHSHMPYVLSHGKSPHGTDWIFESAAECYLPLLDALERLRQMGIRPRWTVNMTPILAEQLDDPAFKAGFEDYCQEKIDIALSDQKNFRLQGPMWMEGIAAYWQRVYTRALVQFKHQWGRSINEAFKFFQDEGYIEIITAGATHGYFPLLGTDESIQAQVKLGVDSYKRRFGRDPRGIWLPECAYRPSYDWKAPVGQGSAWPRKGVEEFLAENRLQYFFVDSHMIRGGEPLGTYGAHFPQLAEMFARSKKMFTPPADVRSEYEHYALRSNGEICFARDPHTTVKVWSGEVGYPGDPQYLEFHKQLYPGRLRYWRISENKADLGGKGPYSPWDAYEQIPGHAQDMVNVVKQALAGYKGVAERAGTLVAMYDTELFGHWWWEGPEFLFEVAVRMHNEPDIEMVSGGDVLDQEPARHAIDLPEGSWGEGGYHHIWLNQDNVWTWEKLYPAQRRFRDLVRKHKDGPFRLMLEQAAREILLAEASDWQFLISTWAARDYAEIRFQDHIDRFNKIAEIVERAVAGTAPSNADEAFIEECRRKDACFPHLDLSWWAQLDRPIPMPVPS